MNNALNTLYQYLGSYEGFGVNHDGQKFRGRLRLSPKIQDKGLSLEFSATGEQGSIFHKEHSLLGLNGKGELSLWVLGSNQPGVLEHSYFESQSNPGAERTLCFRHGSQHETNSFRETISIDLWKNGDLSYNYAWGIPGGEFQERSSVRMLAGKNRPLVPEAKLKTTPQGVVPEGEGWYVINAENAKWNSNERFGTSCSFEGTERFDQYGMNIHILNPGQPSCHYHGEDEQENLLILKGECRLLIEGQERHLKQWDFVHFPKWSRHVCIGMGTEPCVTVMVGGRIGHGVFYPGLELATKYGASPKNETDSPKVSYADCPAWVDAKAPRGLAK